MKEITCKKCDIPAKKVDLPVYEHEEGIPLQNVPAFECPKCKEFIFTKEQVEEMERRTDIIKVEMFTFERKVTISGRSLVINLPEALVKYMNISKGNMIKIIPSGKKRFIVETS